MSDVRARSGWRRIPHQLLVVSGLCGFAIAQPLLALLGENPATVARYGVREGALLAFACLVAFAPPLLLWAPTSAASLVVPRAGEVLHLLTVGALTTVFAVQVAKAAGLEEPLVVAGVAGLTGLGFTAAYIRWRPVATWAACTAVLPVLAVGAFVLASPASALMRPPTEAPTRDLDDAPLPSVVLIVLDELPTKSLLDASGKIDAVRFPHLAALGEDATWYRHHTTLATHTEVALPSLLTGQLPAFDDPVSTSYPDNLFTLLAPTHEIEAVETVTALCPYTSCAATARSGDASAPAAGTQGTRDLLDLTVDLWFDRVSVEPEPPPALDDFADDVAPVTTTTAPAGDPSVLAGEPADAPVLPSARAQALTASFDAGKGPALYFLHLMLPHQPWRHHADGEVYEADPIGVDVANADLDHVISWDPWVAAVYEQRHLLQLQYTDQLLGDAMDALRTAGLYDDSLVIVTADHGISFESDTSPRFVDPSTIDSVAYTPLLVKEPGQQDGSVDDSNLSSLDLLPTIADRLGVTVGWRVDGLPAGSADIARRGGAKAIYDIEGIYDLVMQGVLEFGDEDHLPRAADRWIGAVSTTDDPLAGLTRRLHLDGMLGARYSTLDLDPGRAEGDEAVVDRLEDLRRPPPGAPRVGVVTGRVAGAPTDARLVLAVNGRVVGGSELATDADGNDGRFTVLLPQGVLADANDVRAAIVTEDGGWDLRLVED